MRKSDLILIISIVASAVFLMVVNIQQTSKEPSDQLLITVDGELFGTYSLSIDQTIRIGEHNVCEIADGEARMISADCPDADCLRCAPIGKNQGTIVCLPYRIVLKVTGSDEDTIDTIAG